MIPTIKRAKEIEEAYKIFEAKQGRKDKASFELGLYIGLEITKKILKQIQKKGKRNENKKMSQM